MDGVIVDTEPVHHYAYHEHFRRLGVSVDDKLYASFTGNSTKNVYQKVVTIFGLDRDINELVEEKRSIFNDAFDSKEDIDLLEGVGDLIKDLHRNEVQIILASSSAKVTINRIFNRFGLHQYFDHIVSGEDFPKSKPDPAIFEHAASLARGPKEQCIVIEDSTSGVQAAKGAGIYCVGYNSFHSKMQDLSLADCVINHFNELDYPKINSLLVHH